MQTGFERSRADVKLLADTVIHNAIVATVAMAERRYADAVRSYRLADAGPCPVCILPATAHAYDLAGNADSAIAVFTRFTALPYVNRTATDASFLAGTYKRLGELWEQKGDPQKAVSYYTKFVELWQHADPELQPQVTDVRKRLARLGDSERRK